MDFKFGHVLNLPFDSTRTNTALVIIIHRAILREKSDWDGFENSWGFRASPLLLQARQRQVNHYECLCQFLHAEAMIRTHEMQQLEEENNRIFIDAYGLQDELTSEVPLGEITLTCNPHYRYGGDLTDEEREERLRADTMRELISYAVGCMMGRYSLAEPGLIYAHAGNEGFDPSRYGDFPADDDGIVPITEMEWFDDDAAVRFEEFLKVAWSPETLGENLRFVAESLGANGGSDPQKTIRGYFAEEFFQGSPQDLQEAADLLAVLQRQAQGL